MEQLKYKVLPMISDYTNNLFYLEELCTKMGEIITISNIARTEGILSLEKYAENVVRDKSVGMFLYDCLMLIVDGTEPRLVAEISENRIISEGFDSFSAVLNYVQLVGLLEVQRGTHPRIIVELFKSIVPRQHVEIVHTRLSAVVASIERESDIVSKREWDNATCKNECNPLLRLFEELTKNLVRDDLQTVTNAVEIMQLGNVLYHGSKEVKSRFDDVLPCAVKALFGESVDIYNCSDVGPDILDVLRVIERLRADGSISKCSDYDCELDAEKSNMIIHISEEENARYVNWMTSEKDLSMVYVNRVAEGPWCVHFEEHCYLPTVIGVSRINPEAIDKERMYRDMANHYVYLLSPETITYLPIVEMFKVAEEGNRKIHIILKDTEKFSKSQESSVDYIRCLFTRKAKFYDSTDDALKFFNAVADAEED